MTTTTPRFVILAVMDGWGLAAPGPGNAISKANIVHLNRLWASSPHTQLEASSEAVGLPKGEAGNTETGHLNLGAGRIVYQDLARINMAIADGSFDNNQVLIGAIDHAVKNNSNLHVMGLIGAGGVHSNIEHLFALISLSAKKKFNRLFLHLFTDGRDSPPTAARSYFAKVQEVISREKTGQIASLMGRYWAMDRDRRWDRTQKAYEALTMGKGNLVKTTQEAVENSYANGKTDEFIEPSLITNQAGQPLATITDNDAVIFFNFRIDRPRQLAAAFLVKNFTADSLALDFDPFLERYKKTNIPSQVEDKRRPFKREVFLKNLYFATMTEYSRSLVKAGTKVAFSPEYIDYPLGRVLAEAGMRQLRVAESEKERFVTFYFNGLREEAFDGEERIIVPSPSVPTYDLKPEMSAAQLTAGLTEKFTSGEYRFAIVNYANPDMVGHTGSIGPAARACEVVDEEIGKLVNFTLGYGGVLLVTADHGNVEEMINTQTGQVDTEHSTNPVPFIVVGNQFLGQSQTLQSGILADVAPTVINLLGLKAPSSMTGRNLLQDIP
jgi:2,3-bisphosphoglycerate-independent phosphoglycerate mutase